MTLRLGINGFGRIGRNVLRALQESGRRDMQVVAINDPAPMETLAHLFEFDSVHGRYTCPVNTGAHSLDVGAGAMRFSSLSEPTDLAWDDVDIALECSGHFSDVAAARAHLSNGSRRVLLSAPAKGTVKTIVYGVNHNSITADDTLISNASCTTNCFVTIAHVLHEAFGITRGMMTTVHSYTGNQPTHDAPHDDLYRARAAGLSMIPTSTGAGATLGVVLPELAGRITAQAIRVPTPNVSCIDMTVDVGRSVTPEIVNDAMRAAAKGPLKGILSVTERKLVSTDFNHDPHSAIFASDQTRVQDETMVRVLAWYDNEWGFSNRMLDTARAMGTLL